MYCSSIYDKMKYPVILPSWPNVSENVEHNHSLAKCQTSEMSTKYIYT